MSAVSQSCSIADAGRAPRTEHISIIDERLVTRKAKSLGIRCSDSFALFLFGNNLDPP